ncbi:rhodanese-like domain-containing protein [uncultured Psychroserpens sp.]|uniref:rhodanese-like domain-containing protein n=1 Tax=uncultured Psychroserpens sp. TaxID=255436 RepID=UPI0026019A44|nr:rhodanese-like domain-containing protein [uncultured Psychroserpens sp.]
MSFISALFGKKNTQNESVTLLSPMEFKLKVESQNIQLVDVRTQKEFKSGHLKGAKNIDFFSGRFNIEFDKLDKEKPVYVYCRSGSRSRQTARKLANMGFNEIYDLQGGILNYR